MKYRLLPGCLRGNSRRFIDRHQPGTLKQNLLIGQCRCTIGKLGSCLALTIFQQHFIAGFHQTGSHPEAMAIQVTPPEVDDAANPAPRKIALADPGERHIQT